MADIYGGQRVEIQTEAQRERERLAAQAREASERIRQQALEAQERIRQQQSNAERDAEAAKARAREAERREQRKRDLPITRPTELGTKEVIADIERQRVSAHAEGGKAREDIETEEGKALTDIEKQKAEAEAKIAKWEAENLAKIAEAEREYQRAVAKAEKEAQKALLARPGKEVFDDMVASGDIPKDATFLSYDKTTGIVSYQVPDTRTGKEIFDDMKAKGEIPDDAKYISYDKETGEVKYESERDTITITAEGVAVEGGAPIPQSYIDWAKKQGHMIIETEGVAVEGGAPIPQSYIDWAKSKGWLTIEAEGYVAAPAKAPVGKPPTKFGLAALAAPFKQAPAFIWEYLKATPQRMFPKEESQAELKALYEAQQSQSFWVRFLLGHSVMYDSKSGLYTRIAAGYGPAITPAGGAASALATASKSSESLAVDVAAWQAARQASPLMQAQHARVLAQRAEQAAALIAKAKAAAQAEAALEAAQWTKQAQQAALAIQAALVVAAASFVESASSTQRARVVSVMPSATSIQTEVKGLEVIAEQTATKAKTEGKTRTAIIAAVVNAIQAEVNTITDIDLRIMVQASMDRVISEAITSSIGSVVSLVQVQAVTQAQAQAQVQAQAQALIQSQAQVQPQIQAQIQAQVQAQAQRLRIRIPTPELGKGSSRLLTPEEAEGVIAWKQGFIYKLIYPPYGQKQIVNSRKPLAGVKYYSGIGSAAKSIIAKGGKLPPTIKRDMGIQDITITTKRKGKPTIAFRADIGQRTRLTPKTGRATPRARRQAITPSAVGIYGK